MKVKFTFDKKISYDGYNEITYLKGSTYEASHEKEKACFEGAVNDKHAIIVQDEKVEEKHPAKKADNKVITPKHKK
jgi:hypothetical protein